MDRTSQRTIEENWNDPGRVRSTEEIPNRKPTFDQALSYQFIDQTMSVICMGVALAFMLAIAFLRRKKKLAQVLRQKRGRSGFTMIELMVVMTIISILTALLLPAVQMAREAARRTECKNNLKQIALALHNYESTWRALPRGVTFDTNRDLPQSTWALGLFPYLEKGAEANRWNYGLAPWEGVNLEIARHGGGKIFKCPSSGPNGNAILGDVLVDGSNYFPVGEISPALVKWFIKYEAIEDRSYETVLGIRYDSDDFRNTKLAEIRDGTSNTGVLVESEGGPRKHYIHEHKELVEGGNVFHPMNAFPLDGVDRVTSLSIGDTWGTTNGSLIQKLDNGQLSYEIMDLEPYGIHHGNMNVAMADGSVRGMSIATPLPILIKVLGMADGTTADF